MSKCQAGQQLRLVLSCLAAAHVLAAHVRGTRCQATGSIWMMGAHLISQVLCTDVALSISSTGTVRRSTKLTSAHRPSRLQLSCHAGRRWWAKLGHAW